MYIWSLLRREVVLLEGIPKAFQRTKSRDDTGGNGRYAFGIWHYDGNGGGHFKPCRENISQDAEAAVCAANPG